MDEVLQKLCESFDGLKPNQLVVIPKETAEMLGVPRKVSVQKCFDSMDALLGVDTPTAPEDQE